MLCVSVHVCVVEGPVTFQTEDFVTASECWGAAVHAISLCFFTIFNKSVFGPPAPWQKHTSAVTHSQMHTHLDTERHAHTRKNKTKQNNVCTPFQAN